MLYLVLSTLLSTAFGQFGGGNLPTSCTTDCDPTASDPCHSSGAGYECAAVPLYQDCYKCLPSSLTVSTSDPCPDECMYDSDCCDPGIASCDLSCVDASTALINGGSLNHFSTCNQCVVLSTPDPTTVTSQCPTSECSNALECYSSLFTSTVLMECIVDDVTGCGECIESPTVTGCGECTSHLDCNAASAGSLTNADITAICTTDDHGCGVCEDIADLIGTTAVDDCQPDPTLFCAQVMDPVCCSDGMTYFNDCAARVAGQCECDAGVCTDEPMTTDDCQPDPNTFCAQIFDPVCCSDGMTYSNDCVARAAGQCECDAGVCTDEPATTTMDDCQPDASLICTMDYVPVCCGGMTFSNDCVAKAAGKCDCDAGECIEDPETTDSDMDGTDATNPTDDMDTTDTMDPTDSNYKPPGDGAKGYGLMVAISFGVVMFSWM